jgi:hypothetical protein
MKAQPTGQSNVEGTVLAAHLNRPNDLGEPNDRQARADRTLPYQKTPSPDRSIASFGFVGGRPTGSRRVDGGVDLAMLTEPVQVAFASVQFNFAKQLNRLRFVTRFARIGVGNDSFNIDRHNELLRSDQPGSANSFPSMRI